MERAYLSIDLDYFNYKSKQTMDNILRKVKNFHVPTVVVDSHEDVLDHIKDQSFTTVINVDAHSDYCLSPKDYLECHKASEGDWVDYLGREDRKFLWIHPGSKYAYRCDNGSAKVEGFPLLEGFSSLCGSYKSQRATANTSSIFGKFEITEVSIALSRSGNYTHKTVFDHITDTHWLLEWISSSWVRREEFVSSVRHDPALLLTYFLL